MYSPTSNTSDRSFWFQLLILSITVALLYSINLDRLPNSDEFYHMLAARGILETGAPAIGGEGEYWRAYPTTWLISLSFSLFGESLATARLPSMLAMITMVCVLFSWTYREAGALAAWLTAGLFAVSPFALSVAQFARFYSLQGLCVIIAAWLIYAQLQPRHFGRRLLEALIIIGLLGFATDLQPTTLFLVIGFGLWFVPSAVMLLAIQKSISSRLIVSAISIAVVITIAAVAGFVALGEFDNLWAKYRSTMVFNESHADQFYYYHLWFVLYYPTLWTMAGILAVFALVKAPRFVSLSLVVFLTGFILNSFAAAKNLRYLFYAQPFLFAIWGVGLAQIWQLSSNGREGLRAGLETALQGFFGRHSSKASTALMAAAFFSVILVNPAWLRSVTMLADIAIPPQPPREDWPSAAPVIAPLLNDGAILITGDEVPTLYYFKRADLMFNISKFAELPADRAKPFGRDLRTNVPIIDDAKSFKLAIQCTSKGIFVTPSKWWGDDAYEPEITMRSQGVEALLAEYAQPLDMPQRSRLLAFTWVHDEGTTLPDFCDELPF